MTVQNEHSVTVKHFGLRYVNCIYLFPNFRVFELYVWVLKKLRPRQKCKASVNVMIKNVSWSRNLHNQKQPERMEIFILFAGFTTVASPGYKS